MSYVFFLLIVGAPALVLGFLSPRLISARDDVSVLLGVGVVLLLPVVVALLVRRWRGTGEGRWVVRNGRAVWVPCSPR